MNQRSEQSLLHLKINFLGNKLKLYKIPKDQKLFHQIKILSYLERRKCQEGKNFNHQSKTEMLKIVKPQYKYKDIRKI